MPSPFPGMDPYLEGAAWMGFHTMLSAEIVRQLNPRLRPRYVATLNERFVLDLPESVAVEAPALHPDVGIAQREEGPAAPASGGATAAPLQLATVMPARVRQRSVLIRDAAQRRLVTAIEVFSPTNKQGIGRKQYLAKRRRLLLSDAHFMEIDLLRRGRRVPMQQPLPSAPYFVFLSRAESRPLVDVWPVQFEEPLPTVPVPLLDGDEDVPLDLQAAFHTVYDQLALDLTLDYARPPTVPVPASQRDWLEESLRSAGRK